MTDKDAAPLTSAHGRAGGRATEIRRFPHAEAAADEKTQRHSLGAQSLYLTVMSLTLSPRRTLKPISPVTASLARRSRRKDSASLTASPSRAVIRSSPRRPAA